MKEKYAGDRKICRIAVVLGCRKQIVRRGSQGEKGDRSGELPEGFLCASQLQV
jgi:hypothetical protein